MEKSRDGERLTEIINRIGAKLGFDPILFLNSDKLHYIPYNFSSRLVIFTHGALFSLKISIMGSGMLSNNPAFTIHFGASGEATVTIGLSLSSVRKS